MALGVHPAGAVVGLHREGVPPGIMNIVGKSLLSA